MALFYECMLSCVQRVLDIADIVRDRDVSTAIPTNPSDRSTNLWRAFAFPESMLGCLAGRGNSATKTARSPAMTAVAPELSR